MGSGCLAMLLGHGRVCCNAALVAIATNEVFLCCMWCGALGVHFVVVLFCLANRD